MRTYVNNKDYIEEKVKVLSQLGLKNKDAVKAYLLEKTANCTNPVQKEIKCDIAARTILMSFYDGDKTFATTRD